MGKRWYVVHAFSGFEKQVAQSLKEHIDRAGMQDAFGTEQFDRFNVKHRFGR